MGKLSHEEIKKMKECNKIYLQYQQRQKIIKTIRITWVLFITICTLLNTVISGIHIKEYIEQHQEEIWEYTIMNDQTIKLTPINPKDYE